ncbi:MAG: hypothetical protein HQL77_16245 [Magnetococcales bacterium]|nr:hypothetical protein [Magnetococcales bacterium]MBF0436904.1 hypothetical protein [Magnetococcales bacterium]
MAVNRDYSQIELHDVLKDRFGLRPTWFRTSTSEIWVNDKGVNIQIPDPVGVGYHYWLYWDIIHRVETILMES